MPNPQHHDSSSAKVLVGASLALTVVALTFLVSALVVPPGGRMNYSRQMRRTDVRENAPAAVRGTTLPSQRLCDTTGCLYQNNNHLFSIQYPKDWEVREGLFGTIVSFVSPLTSKKDQFSENINIVSEPVAPGTTLEQYYDGSEENLKKYFTQFKVIKVASATLGGSPARVVTYSANQGNVKLRTTQIFSLRGTKAYIVTISNIQSNPTVFFPEMVKMADSFTFANP